MSLLNQLFNRGVFGSKCNTCLNLTISRIKLPQNKRDLQLKHMRNFFRLDEKQWLEFELNVYHGKRIYGLHMRYWSCSSSLYLRVFPFLKVIGGSKQIVAEATLPQAPTKQSSPLSPLSNGVHGPSYHNMDSKQGSHHLQASGTVSNKPQVTSNKIEPSIRNHNAGPLTDGNRETTPHASDVFGESSSCHCISRACSWRACKC